MNSNRDQIHEVLHQPVPVTAEVLEMLSAARDSVVAQYYGLKLLQPSWRQLLFTAETGPTINSTSNADWLPRSLRVYNPTSMPVYLSTGGANPLATGIAIQPTTISPRLPILGANVTVGLDPALVDLATTQYLVHLFRYASPD